MKSGGVSKNRLRELVTPPPKARTRACFQFCHDQISSSDAHTAVTRFI